MRHGIQLICLFWAKEVVGVEVEVERRVIRGEDVRRVGGDGVVWYRWDCDWVWGCCGNGDWSWTVMARGERRQGRRRGRGRSIVGFSCW